MMLVTTARFTSTLNCLFSDGLMAVVVLGDPAYYGRFGFKPAATYGLNCRWPDTESAFQVYPLAEDALNGVSGEVAFSAPFNRF